MSNIVVSKEQLERAEYWANYIKEHPYVEDEDYE